MAILGCVITFIQMVGNMTKLETIEIILIYELIKFLVIKTIETIKKT